MRGKLKRTSWTVKRFNVNGPLLERWFLKTLIYLSVSGDWAIGLGSHKKGTPSQQLVRIAFGHEAFEPYEGLYIAGYPGENIDSMDRVSFAPMTEGDNLVVGRFNFRGYRFYLSLVPEKVENFEGSPLLYRNSNLRFMVQDRLSHIVRLRW